MQPVSRALWWVLLTIVGPLVCGVLIGRLFSSDPWLLTLYSQALLCAVLTVCIIASCPPQQLAYALRQEGFEINKAVRQSLQEGCNYIVSVHGDTPVELTLACSDKATAIVRRDWAGHRRPGRYIVYTITNGVITKSVAKKPSPKKTHVPLWHPEFTESAQHQTSKPVSIRDTVGLLRMLHHSPSLVAT